MRRSGTICSEGTEEAHRDICGSPRQRRWRRNLYPPFPWSRPRPLRPAALVLLGLVTGALCALSGAGGPVVVMPLLVALGVPAKEAVGAALLDSVFIALPALGVYGLRGGFTGLFALAALCAAAHGVGVAAGSATSQLVPQEGLKRGVAVFSICFSLYMLLR